MGGMFPNTSTKGQTVKTFTARFIGYPAPRQSDGECRIEKTRKSENDYTHASYAPGRGIAFHQSGDAAYRRAGKRGAVQRVDGRDDVG